MIASSCNGAEPLTRRRESCVPAGDSSSQSSAETSELLRLRLQQPINVQVSRQLHSVFLSYIPKDAEGCAVSGGRMSDHSFTLFCKRSAIVGELLADMIYVVVKPQVGAPAAKPCPTCWCRVKAM